MKARWRPAWPPVEWLPAGGGRAYRCPGVRWADTGNGDLAGRVLVPVSQTIPAPSRYTLFHRGRGQMLDHLLVTRNLLGHYRGTEIHNEILHDESVVFGTDRKRPESDQTAMVATFESADNAATWSPTTSA